MANLKLWIKFKRIFDSREEEIDFDSFTKFPIFFLKLVSLNTQEFIENPHGTDILKTKVKSVAEFLVNKLFLIFMIIAGSQLFAYGVVNFHSEGFEIIINATCDSLSAILIFTKGFTVLFRKQKIKEVFGGFKSLYENHEKDCEFKLKPYLDGFYRVIRIYFVIFFIFNLSAPIFVLIYLLDGRKILVANYWFPFNYENNRFILSLIWTQCLAYLAPAFLLIYESLICVYITMITMHFDKLKHDYTKLKMESNGRTERQIANLVERHNRLFEICDRLQEIFAPTFLYNFIISSFILCLLCFQILFNFEDLINIIFHINYLLLFISQIWLSCYLGQKLIDSSDGVAYGIYESDWTGMDDKLRKQIALVLVRAQRPKALTAMGFADVSLETFAAVRYCF